MWIFSKFGFYSIVRTSVQYNPDEDYMIRARTAEHLEALKAATDIKNNVIRTTDSDYKFRLVVSEADYRKVMEVLEKSIDYTNFKNACHRFNPEDSAYHKALHDVWSVMYRMQIMK